MTGLIDAAYGFVVERLILAAAAGLACTKNRSDFLTDSSATEIMDVVNQIPDGLSGERVRCR
ncbi:MAG: hypothetical protein WA820_13245 [Bradyrhizobium sp.]|jgi:hypothetical protein